MNKFNKLFLLGLSSTLLCGCSVGENASSSETASYSEASSHEESVSSEATSSSESSSETSPWPSALVTLMEDYCGEVLPFPNALSGCSLIYRETTQKDETTYLEIRSEAAKFTLKEYYEDLGKAGWNLIQGYGDFETRESGAIEFSELTKADESKGYDITYYYQESSSTDAFEGNVICCYNNLNSEMNESSAWTLDEKASMKTTLTEFLPFLALGKGYSASSTGTDDFLICDTSLTDLRKEYSDLLVENGFVLDDDLSLAYGFYILTKNLDNGSSLVANLDYSGGNYFTFSFKMQVKKTSKWPSSALADIEKTAGVTIPAFEAKGQYYSCSKNGVVYIYATVDSAIEYDTDYLSQLDAIGLIDYDGYGTMTNWEETFSLAYGYISQGSTEYFEIVVSLVTPTSQFSSAWPKEVIQSAFKKLKAGDVSFPVPTLPALTKDIKYTTETSFNQMYEYCYKYIKEYSDSYNVDPNDAEAMDKMTMKLAKELTGVDMSFYDKDGSIYKALDSYYYNLGYHVDSSITGNLLYEDPTGKMSISFYTSYAGVTYVHVGLGSEEAHTPILSFPKESYSLGIGTSTKLGLKMDMLPYGVSYSIDDTSKGISVSEDGVITIASTATLGDKVTLTASVQIPGGDKVTASCEIVVAERSEYSYKTAMDAVVKLFNGVLGLKESDSTALYTCYDEENDYYWVLHNFIQSQTHETGDQVKEIVQNSLIPEGFNLSSDWVSGTSSHGYPEYVCSYVADGITLEYTVTLNDGIILVMIRSYASSL